MILEQEGKKTVNNPTVNQIKKAISSLRNHGPSSFASITNSGGKYLQVAGGGITCMLELYDPETKKRFRAFSDKKNPAFPDGTLLVFGAGKLAMQSDEWLSPIRLRRHFVTFQKRTRYQLILNGGQLLVFESKLQDVVRILAGGNPSKAASISVTLRSSKSQSNTAQISDGARGSTVKARGNVNIVPKGRGRTAPSWSRL